MSDEKEPTSGSPVLQKPKSVKCSWDGLGVWKVEISSSVPITMRELRLLQRTLLMEQRRHMKKLSLEALNIKES